MSPLQTKLKVLTFQRGELAINVRHEWSCSLPSISCCWWSFSSTISRLLSFLQSITLLACLLDASHYMPAVVLYYCTFQDNTVRLKMFYYLCLCFFMCYLYGKYYSAEPTGDLVSIPGFGRSPEVGNGNPIQYSCLGNSMDRGAW